MRKATKKEKAPRVPRKQRNIETKPVKLPKEKKNTVTSFFDGIVATTQNSLAQAASNGIISGDVKGWIDTGVLLFNAQLSGSLFGGCPDNKIVVFAGPAATGKTFFMLSMVKYFLEKNKDAGIIYFESEGAIDTHMLEERGIDTSRFWVVPVSTVQEFTTQAKRILKKYASTPEEARRPMMMCLDSLGMLSTSKEMADTTDGKDTKDMTRAGLIKGSFRALTLELAVNSIPLLVTNHTYETMGLFSSKVMGGGSGAAYANSVTVFLSKKKAKDGDEVTGCFITCKLQKGRMTKENTVIKVHLDYAKGLQRYSGLLDFGIETGIITKSSKGIYTLPDGVEATQKQIKRNPAQYFDPVLPQFEEACQKYFRYGSNVEVTDEDVDDVEETEENSAGTSNDTAEE